MMAKHTELPPVVFDNVPIQVQPNLPAVLPPSPITPPSTEVTVPHQALDAVEEHVVPLGVADLPGFFDV
jgi:hypothetical protein